MYRLGSSVGQGAPNNHDDVVIVQTLLNKNTHIADSFGRVPESGTLDDATQRAIIAFQRDVVHIAAPDGRVDPKGRTFRVLTGDSPHGATVAFVHLDEDGDGFYRYATPDKLWGTPAAIQSVRNLGVAMKRLDLVIGIGEISFINGGRMPPHASHRRGIDVDIRPQRTDGTRLPVNIADAAYSRENTRKVVLELQKDENLDFMFFNDTTIKGVRFWEGHNNHIHVRFKS